MKTRTLFSMMVAVALVFSLFISAMAADEAAFKTEFTGTWCRWEVDSGTTTALPSGRRVRKGGAGWFHVDVNNPMVAGEFESTDVAFNFSAPEPVDYPIPKNVREGLVHASFILTPYDSSINGTWEGMWKARYIIDDGWFFFALEANAQGTGDLAGLKLRVNVTDYPFYDIDCDNLDVSYPNPFNGYILDPNLQAE